MPGGRLQFAHHGAGRPQRRPGLDPAVWDEHVGLAESGQRVSRLTPPTLGIWRWRRRFGRNDKWRNTLRTAKSAANLAVDLAVAAVVPLRNEAKTVKVHHLFPRSHK